MNMALSGIRVYVITTPLLAWLVFYLFYVYMFGGAESIVPRSAGADFVIAIGVGVFATLSLTLSWLAFRTANRYSALYLVAGLTTTPLMLASVMLIWNSVMRLCD
jgi:hypothetical protein